MPPPTAPAPRSPLLRRLVMSLVVFAAVGGLVYVGSSSSPTQQSDKPEAVEAVAPQGGDLDLRQATIAADLAPGYTGYLLLDGNEIPDDDLQHVDALNTVTLRPLPGSDYATLSPGTHCATVVYRHFGEPRDASNSYRWCFKLH